MKNIYIDNLDYSTTEDQLRTLFLPMKQLRQL